MDDCNKTRERRDKRRDLAFFQKNIRMTFEAGP